jgi:hypothetical protein
VDELESAEEKTAELKKILREGRYCDYISFVLAKMKQTEAWQKADFKKLEWVLET